MSAAAPPAALVRRVLVIRRKALGDVLVTLPSVLRLARAYPEAALDLVVERPYAPLVAGLAPSLRVLAWPPPAGEPAAWTRRLRGAGYDLVLDYLGSPRTALWTALTGARWRVGYDLPGRRWAYNVRVPRSRHGDVRLAQFAGEGFLDPLRVLGLPAESWRPWGPWAPGGEPGAASGAAGSVASAGISAGAGGVAGSADAPGWPLGAAYRAWAAGWRARPQPRVGLVLSASWPAKAWPAAEAAALLRLAAQAGRPCLLIPGPDDRRLCDGVTALAPAADVAPPTSLVELADLLGTLSCLVGTDSGPRHLAALLGVPTVTLFGPTDPRGWNPPGPQHVAVRTGEPCSPCDRRECPVPGHPCMTRLTAATVWANVQELLARAARGPSGEPRRA